MPSSTPPSSRLKRWLQREPAPAPAPRAPDPAEMGTCFGLDMSLSDTPVNPFVPAPERALRRHRADGETDPGFEPAPFRRTAPGGI